MAKNDPFGKACPRRRCTKKITRATGDVESDAFVVRCDAGHRFEVERSKGELRFTEVNDESDS